jgi:hypothetical protein
MRGTWRWRLAQGAAVVVVLALYLVVVTRGRPMDWLGW